MADSNKTLFPTDGSLYLREATPVGWQPDGSYRFASTLTPAGQPSISVGFMPPSTVVPIIFVPGIMGSNLKAKRDIEDGRGNLVIKTDTSTWRVDSTGGLVKEWLNRKQDQYQLRFQSDKVTVDDRGLIAVRDRAEGTPADFPDITPLACVPEAEARRRGWGTVAAAFYGEFLDWLDAHLNQARKHVLRGDPQDNPQLAWVKLILTQSMTPTQPVSALDPLTEQDAELLLKADNPVHAFGYNWLQSNMDSGQQLARYIQQVIDNYNTPGRSCKQVILITHSMGGLVARAACQVHGAAEQVAGVFHGVMPTDGAAATYKRMVSGFGGEPTQGLKGWIKDWIGSAALGPTGDYVTPSLALNAGPLELLPNSRYNGGKPWLKVTDESGNTLAKLPAQGDPYQEIYLEQRQWWRLLNQEWMNPASLDQGGSLRAYGQAIDRAKSFHKQVQEAGDFHPVTHAHYGADTDHLAYGTVSWKLNKAVDAERHAALKREHLPNVEQMTGTHIYLRDGDWGVHARLSEPDAPGDGTVPAAASASAVDAAAKPGRMVLRGWGYSHDASYDIQGLSEGPHAALQAVVRILKEVMTEQPPATTSP